MEDQIVIVGCGVFGLSTALELVRGGLRGDSVVMLDVEAPPSGLSAACDANKIVRCEYNKEAYTRLAIEALALWRTDALFMRSYVECGRVMVTPSHHAGRIQYEQQGIANLRKYGHGSRYEYWKGGDELARRFVGFAHNNVPSNREVKWNPDCGLGRSSHTLVHVYEFLKDRGVRFVFGERGRAVSLASGAVTTATGEIFTGDKVVVALGASTGALVNLHNQQSATGLFVTHVQLTAEEIPLYANNPVVYDGNMGYFFPPDETGRIKLCLNGGGVKHETEAFGACASLPRFCASDTIPVERVGEVRAMLSQYLPKLENRPLLDSKVCWIGDTLGGEFLIDAVPYLDRVYVATGDSGHGYKFFPNIGHYICQAINGGIKDRELAAMWSWKDRRGQPLPDPALNKWRITNGTRDISMVDFYKL